MPYQPVEVPADGDWEIVRRNFQALRRDMNPPVPQARVFNNANITLTTAVTATLTFNSERYDNGDLHSTSVNTSRLTVPITGLYKIGAHVSFAASATGFRYVDLLLNGTTILVVDTRAAAGAGVVTVSSVATESRLAAGDYVEVRAVQSSGGNLDVVAAANYSPDFWMHRVAGYVNQGV